MPSQSKSQSARTNGAKSHGPSTEAGRARSSQNALKHGFSAQTLLLPSEDPAEFQQLLAAYLDDFHPAGPVELDLVHQLVAAKWRLDRLAIIETELFTGAIQHEEERAADNDDEPLTAAESLTKAFRSLANSPYLTFLHRTESRLERCYSRALRNLLQLQRLRQSPATTADPPPPENQICKNEPNQTAEPLGFHPERIGERGDAPDDSEMLQTHQAGPARESGTRKIRIGNRDAWEGVQRSAPPITALP